MCGRYSLIKPSDVLSKRFKVQIDEAFKPHYNAAPGQTMPVITNKRPTHFSMFHWGLIPNWSLDDKISSNLINARAETILTKSPFKQGIKTHRCIIPEIFCIVILKSQFPHSRFKLPYGSGTIKRLPGGCRMAGKKK